MTMIISNAAYCKNCDEILTSERTLPPIICSCQNVKIWGGYEFLGHSAHRVSKYRNWSITIERSEETIDFKMLRGG